MAGGTLTCLEVVRHLALRRGGRGRRDVEMEIVVQNEEDRQATHLLLPLKWLSRDLKGIEK